MPVEIISISVLWVLTLIYNVFLWDRYCIRNFYIFNNKKASLEQPKWIKELYQSLNYTLEEQAFRCSRIPHRGGSVSCPSLPGHTHTNLVLRDSGNSRLPLELEMFLMFRVLLSHCIFLESGSLSLFPAEKKDDSFFPEGPGHFFFCLLSSGCSSSGCGPGHVAEGVHVASQQEVGYSRCFLLLGGAWGRREGRLHGGEALGRERCWNTFLNKIPKVRNWELQSLLWGEGYLVMLIWGGSWSLWPRIRDWRLQEVLEGLVHAGGNENCVKQDQRRQEWWGQPGLLVWVIGKVVTQSNVSIFEA